MVLQGRHTPSHRKSITYLAFDVFKSKTHLVVAIHLTAVLGLEGRAQADGDALTDEGKAAQEAVLAGEHVHGAALAPADARGLCVQLRHHCPAPRSVCVCVCVQVLETTSRP